MTFVETSNLSSAALSIRRGANPWTIERIDLLTALWRDGQSAGQIALQLDHLFTRSAVLGKVHRLGLSGQEGVKPHAKYGAHWANSRRPEGFRRKALPKTSAAPVYEPPALIAAIERSEAACTFAELSPGMCRYPFGEPRDADFAYCGRHADGTYCAGHHTITHRVPA